MMDGELGLQWCAGYAGSPLSFVSSDALVYGHGNALSVVSRSAAHVRSVSSAGSGVGAVAACPGRLAYAETTVKPRIFVLSYPQLDVECVLQGTVQLEYSCLAISTDGGKVASLSGVPEHQLAVWAVAPSSLLCQTVAASGVDVVSFNPLSWKQLCCVGVGRLCLWSVEQCDSTMLLSPIDVQLPDSAAPVGRQARTQLTGLEQFTQTCKEPGSSSTMELVSHCWGTTQNVFVGCAGGQLLSVDSDSGDVDVLANPSLLQHALGSAEVSTAHSAFSAGSLECLGLSKRGLFTVSKDGVVSCFRLGGLQLVDSCSTGHCSLLHTAWSPACDLLAIGNSQGAVLFVDPNGLSVSAELYHGGTSAFVGADLLSPHLTHCVSCRRDGSVQVWQLCSGALVSTLHLSEQASAVCCPLCCELAVVGTASGQLCFVSLTDVAAPRLVTTLTMYSTAVTLLRNDHNAKYLASAAEEGPVYVFNSLPSSGFDVVGYTAVLGRVLDLSLLPLDCGLTRLAVLCARSEGGTRLTLLHLPAEIAATGGLWEDGSRLLSASAVLMQQFVIGASVSVLSLAPPHSVFMCSAGELLQFSLPRPQEEGVQGWELTPDGVFPGHELNAQCSALSQQHKWLVSAGRDGSVLLRHCGSPEAVTSCRPHHYATAGCSAVAISADAQYLLTAGDANTLTCWQWSFTSRGSEIAAKQLATKFLAGLEATIRSERQALAGMSCSHQPSSTTWLDKAQNQVRSTEDCQYTETRRQLVAEVTELRGKVLAMIAANSELPELEQLTRLEFILDVEEHSRLELAEQTTIAMVREEVRLSDLAALFLRDQIKSQCWDGMHTKGKSLKAFQSSLEVSNYPTALAGNEEQPLAKTNTLRNIDISDQKVRAEVGLSVKQALPVEDVFLEEQDGEEGRVQTSAETAGDPDALVGSHGTSLGGGSPLLSDQFLLHTPVAKKHHISLLQSCIKRIKEAFNTEFEEVFRLKEAEIAHINEKNTRISKILYQLKLKEELVSPCLSGSEQPASLLTVQDEEVGADRYLSPEEQRRKEEASRLEEQRRLAEMGDNPRERALDMMMGGRLEANVEEDLFKEMMPPAFMSKEPADMTEEEIKLAREFEVREAAFLEEREKLRKSLEAELRKLQASISQSMEQFDDRLTKLFRLKIQTEMAVHQEELKELSLAHSLITEEQFVYNETDTLESLKAKKVQLGSVLADARHRVEEVREVYEQLVAEDKEMDRAFKRNFADTEPFTDQLYKLFRKRPRGQKLKPGASESSVVVITVQSQNPFVAPPPAATSLQTETAMEHFSHAPDGLEPHIWDKLVAARRSKMDSELKVKSLALKLAEMSAFVARRQAEDELLQQKTQDVFQLLTRLQERKTMSDLDIEIQLLLKQGQVEVDSQEFVVSFSDAVLVPRKIIEDLNKHIKNLGDSKLASMGECKDFKRGINMLEWEHKKMAMEAQDLVDKARDIQMLRVTKELQQRLMEENVVSKDHQEIETLEKTLQLNTQMYKKAAAERERALRKLVGSTEARAANTSELKTQLVGLQVAVTERKQVEQLAGVPPVVANRRQQMQDIVKRRRLVELAKAQAHEISVLRTEVERLRMRTFPALVQVD